MPSIPLANQICAVHLPCHGDTLLCPLHLSATHPTGQPGLRCSPVMSRRHLASSSTPVTHPTGKGLHCHLSCHGDTLLRPLHLSPIPLAKDCTVTCHVMVTPCFILYTCLSPIPLAKEYCTVTCHVMETPCFVLYTCLSPIPLANQVCAVHLSCHGDTLLRPLHLSPIPLAKEDCTVTCHVMETPCFVLYTCLSPIPLANQACTAHLSCHGDTFLHPLHLSSIPLAKDCAARLSYHGDTLLCPLHVFVLTGDQTDRCGQA